MIKVRSLNGSEIVVNAELIRTVEATPDTVITLSSGHRLIVRDSVDDVIRRVIDYRREIRRGVPHLLVEANAGPTPNLTGQAE